MANSPLQRFITIEEAIELINASTRKNPTVDIPFMLRGFPYLRKNGTFNIKLLTRDSSGKVVSNGSKFIRITSDFDKETFKHAVTTRYTELTNKSIDADSIGVKSMTSAIDDKANPTGRMIVNDKPMTKFGDDTTGGNREVTE